MSALSYDVVIIGGGPAGMAAALASRKQGAKTLILERDVRLGGILNQCIHQGFGLHYFGEEMTGPEYADRFRKMVEAGTAQAILGNHELNALYFWQKDPNGGYLREHTINKILIHSKTMASFQHYQPEFYDHLDWFLSLPLFIETENFRAQHACFDMENIQTLRREGLEIISNRENLFRILANKKIRRAVMDTVQGPEVELENGATYRDSEEVLRTRARIKWWMDPKGKTLLATFTAKRNARTFSDITGSKASRRFSAPMSAVWITASHRIKERAFWLPIALTGKLI